MAVGGRCKSVHMALLHFSVKLLHFVDIFVHDERNGVLFSWFNFNNLFYLEKR